MIPSPESITILVHSDGGWINTVPLFKWKRTPSMIVKVFVIPKETGTSRALILIPG
jgi:hypothetical protein